MIASLIRRTVPKRFRPIGYLTQLVRKRTDCKVRLGPFKGMRYVSDSIGSAYLPKLLGTYERELAPNIESICADRPQVIVVLGAAEGYYAVGLALRNPEARVVAFEQGKRARNALRQMVHLNGVADRVEIRDRCEPSNLQASLRPVDDESSRPPFVLSDVEGDERALMDPVAVPALRRAVIQVETHDFIHAGITDLIAERFAPTHEVQRILQQPRSRREFPYRTIGTALLPNSYLDWAVSEWRPARMSWLWMTPHA